MAMFSSRGLNNFISELRSSSSREQEQKRIDTELVKIRQKFSQPTPLSSYDTKKYAWKLIYIYMLGYEVDFGHMQVINLVSATKYSEKCLGYLGVSILLKSSDELMTLVVNSIRNDLNSKDMNNQCLALSCVANLGGSELTEALAPDISNLLMSSAGISHVRKKVVLCTRRILPRIPELVPLDELEKRLHTLMSETHLGIVTSTASLLSTALTLHPTSFRSIIDVCVYRLNALVLQKECSKDYLYYSTPCPWLQVKLLRLLQQYGEIEDSAIAGKLDDTLRRILSRPNPGKGAKHNALYAVLIETVNLVLHRGRNCDVKLKELSIDLLARFISVSEPNIRYIGLDAMHRWMRLGGDREVLKPHKSTILFSLKDADNSVRRRALDLLFTMCDVDMAQEIVGELVNYLTIAEGSIREEIVLKVAILAEKYATNLRWYVDTVLQLLTMAGSDVPDDVWHRVVQIVTNREDLQKYTAEVMFRALEPSHVDETTIKCGAYILGEFGYLICDTPDMGCLQQFEILHQHYGHVNTSTKCLLLTAFVKMENLYEEVRPSIQNLFQKCITNMDLEIQQRACEYISFHQVDEGIMKNVLEPMPVFPDNRESALIVRLRNQKLSDNTEEGIENPATLSSSPSNIKAGEDNDGKGKKEIDLLSLDDINVAPKAMASGGNPNGIRMPNPVAELFDVFGAPPPASTITNGIDANTAGKMSEWRRNLLLNSQSILFENDMIQIGLKHEYRGSQGRLQIFYGNKTPGAFHAFSAKVNVENCKSNFRLQVEDVGSEVPSKQQVKQQIMIECMVPSVHLPLLKVQFTPQNDKVQIYDIPLPCEAVVFMEPVPMDTTEYIKRWQALSSQNGEQQIIHTTKRPIDIIQVKSWVTSNLKFAIPVGADINSSSLSISGILRTGSVSSSGEKVSIGCLAKVEANNQTSSYRITVTSSHPDVSIAVKNCIQYILT